MGYGFKFLIEYLGNHFKARAKYEELDDSYIDLIIENVIMNNDTLFDKDYVLGYKNGKACKMCGRCCEKQHCYNYNKKTKKCNIWDKRPDICRDFPFGEESIFLDSYCGYIVDFFMDQIEYFLDKKV